jgi:hypothetical protein
MYIIAIPSYDRVDILKNKTLKLLENNNIKKSRIIIFVANKEEEAKYKQVFSNYKIVIGVKGLLPQRNFMTNYFKNGQHIIYMDDDIEAVMIKEGDLKEDKKLHNIDLHDLFVSSFKLLTNTGLFIWGVNPLINPYFLYNKVTTDLRYICGALYGVINRHDKDLSLQFESDKEDVERTLRYFKKDGGVMRFNNIGTKTKYYNAGGLQSEYETKQQRIKDGEKRVKRLLDAFPHYGRVKQRKNGIWEFVFINNPKL